MPLPNCGVDVGTRLTWWGARPHPSCLVRETRASEIEAMIFRIDWSNRLTRDPRLDRTESLVRMCRSLWSDPGFRFVDFDRRGFVFFGLPQGDTTRVNLIGVLPEHRGQGVAKSLLALAPTSYIIAGTYEDNEASCALYKKIGLEIVRRERVHNE